MRTFLYIWLFCRGAAEFSEVHDLGNAFATGLCILPGADPIVSFPKWGATVAPDQPKFALAYVRDKVLEPFEGLRSVDEDDAGNPKKDLVSVQALFCPPPGSDGAQVMWVLDSGKSPMDQELLDGAAKLLKVIVQKDGRAGTVERVYTFKKDIAPDTSYLNDVRVDGKGFAYITDSNSGTILILELVTGVVHVWKDERMQPKLDEGEKFMIGDKDMSFMLVAVDGIAYSSLDDMLYWKPVTRSQLFRIPAQKLRDSHKIGFMGAAEAVESAGTVGFHDGIDADEDGNVYLTDLANGGIQVRSVHGEIALVTEKGAMHWPDCVIAAKDSLWVLTTQVHLMPFLNDGKDMRTAGNKLLYMPRQPHWHAEEL